ncbi:MAG: hypothetical protein NZ899_03835 [Thermoguttaceae bacterium]|nr:hypothetical protein [Thermoguttaceae bacterium]MDW8077736.1 hypothetical protein [Thermoguttaceae bacterium]
MKGIYGLFLAIALGLVGAGFNYLYLQSKAGQIEMVHFIGIRLDRDLPEGHRLTEGDLVRVGVPKPYVGNLDQFALRDTAWNSVIGQAIVRAKPGGSLLFADDIRTPPAELRLEPNEVLLWIPVDTKSFVPSLVNPGDRVSFLISRGMLPPSQPTTNPADEPESTQATIPQPADQVEVVGPFTVASVGSRVGSAEVFRATRVPASHENVIGIRIALDSQGKVPPEVVKLKQLLDATGYRPVAVMLHGKGR